MTGLLREVQAADFLGYQEIRDFRAALKANEIPAPCRSLGVGRRRVEVWSRSELQNWIDNSRDNSRTAIPLNTAIDGLS